MGFRYILFVGLLCLTACQSKPEQAAMPVQEKAKPIKAEDIDQMDYIDYVLSPQSLQAVQEWKNFQDLQAQLDLLKKADVSFFKMEKEMMSQFIEELKSTQPSNVKTSAIRSRLTVLETNLLRLQDLATLDNLRRQEMLDAIHDLLVANANLKLQINKKFEKESQQIQLPVGTP